MKKIVVVILLFCISYPGIAQMTLEPLLPQVGLFTKSQLWNIIAINNSPNSEECYVALSLVDRQTGVEVMTATSSSFSLDKGSKQLNGGNLAPIQYNYFSATGDKNDFLP